MSMPRAVQRHALPILKTCTEDDETSTNEGRSKYLRTADQGIDPSIMQHEETVQEYEHKENEVSYL